MWGWGGQVPQLLSYLQLISLLSASSSHHSLTSRNIGSPAGSPPSHIHLPTINQHLASPPVIPTPTHPSLFTLVAPKRHFARKSGLITQTTPSPRTLGLFFPWKELDKGMGRGWIWDNQSTGLQPSNKNPTNKSQANKDPDRFQPYSFLSLVWPSSTLSSSLIVWESGPEGSGWGQTPSVAAPSFVAAT